MTGSIGFAPILRQAGLSATINNFKPFHLEPWDQSTAVGCLRALANGGGLRFEDGAAEKATEMLGCCIPHHVQMFFAHLYENCKRRGDTLCTELDVEHVYRTAMLSTRGHAELSTFEERLKIMVGSEGVPFVLDLLTEAAVVGILDADAVSILRTDYRLGDRSGLERTREVLDILDHDGYLRKTPAGFVFVSNLLRDWWRARFEWGYVPARDRGAAS